MLPSLVNILLLYISSNILNILLHLHRRKNMVLGLQMQFVNVKVVTV